MTDGIRAIIRVKVTQPMIDGTWTGIDGAMKAVKMMNKIAKKFHLTWDMVNKEHQRQMDEIAEGGNYELV